MNEARPYRSKNGSLDCLKNPASSVDKVSSIFFIRHYCVYRAIRKEIVLHWVMFYATALFSNLTNYLGFMKSLSSYSTEGKSLRRLVVYFCGVAPSTIYHVNFEIYN